MIDTLRWITVFVALFDIGVTIALFERIGRFFIPRLPMRMLMLANMIALAAVAEGAHSRLGHEFVWFATPVFLAAALLELAALVALHYWYGTARGRAHAARMLAGSGDEYLPPLG